MTVRVVVVGAGKMGAHHARVFACASGATLVGVLDVDHAVAARVAARHQAIALGSLDEAIERAHLVVVATPTSEHYAQTRRALAAGRHVLVEKPVAATLSEARALCDVARATGTLLVVGHSERFNPVVRAIARDSAGDEVLRIVTRRTTTGAPGDELCMNLAVHDIDLVAHLARERAELVSASGDGDSAEIALRIGRGVAHAHVARGASERVRTIHVQTTRFSYFGDLLEPSLLRDGAPLAMGSREPLALQADAVLAALATHPTDVASGEDGARAVDIAERCVIHHISAAE